MNPWPALNERFVPLVEWPFVAGYTGLIAGFVANALARGQWSSVLGVAIACGAIWHKSRIEERVLHDAFGRQYDDYKRDTASLIPFVL